MTYYRDTNVAVSTLFSDLLSEYSVIQILIQIATYIFGLWQVSTYTCKGADVFGIIYYLLQLFQINRCST